MGGRNKGSSGRSKRGRSRGGSHSAADPANNLSLKVGDPPDVAATRKYNKNRIKILHLLLTACCDPLFSPADECNPLTSRRMSVTVAADAPNAPCLLYSLLNTIMGYDPSGSGLAMSHSNKFASDTHTKVVSSPVRPPRLRHAACSCRLISPGQDPAFDYAPVFISEG